MPTKIRVNSIYKLKVFFYGALCGLGAYFLLGFLIHAYEPAIERWWHYRMMHVRFSKQMALSHKYVAKPYANLRELLMSSFTVGDAYEHLGTPQRQQHPYRSETDRFFYWDWEKLNKKNHEYEEEKDRVSSLVLVFTNFVLSEWWPCEINEIAIRNHRGEWTSSGIEVHAWEKWPGTKVSE